MLARSAKVLVSNSCAIKRVSALPTRSFFSFGKANTILTDREQQGGRRAVEIDMEEKGSVAYNREPIVPDVNAGTKENPILVPSGESHRAVGFEDPVTHQVEYFNLHSGNLHYVPSIGLYFKLQPIGAAHHH